MSVSKKTNGTLYWEFYQFIPDIRSFVLRTDPMDETQYHPRVLEEEAEKAKTYRKEII